MSPSTRLTLFVVIAFALAARPGAAQVIPGGSARDYEGRHKRRQAEFRSSVLSEMTTVMDRWKEAWSHDKTDRVSGFYTDDAVLVPADGTSPARGQSEIEAYFKRTLPILGEITTSLQDFDVGGSLAFAMGTFAYSVPGPNVGTRTIQGQFVAVFRLDRGHWKIRSQIFEERT